MKRATLKPKVLEILQRKKPKKYLKAIPEVKPLSLKAGAFIFGGLSITGILIGTTIGTYVFFGAITLAGLIAIVESNKYFRYIITKSNRLLDVLIFTLTIYATVSLGITMTASLTFAGLGYTLVYAPWIRSRII
jgi:hypothetical protein